MREESTFHSARQLVALCVIVIIIQGIPSYGAPLLIAAMAKDHGFSREAVGGVMSGYMVCFGIASPLAAAFIHRFGSRAALCAGGLVAVLASFLIATIVHTPPAMIFAFGVLIGTSTALGGMLPAMTVLSYWFPARRTTVLSILFCAVSLGGIGLVAMLAGLLRIGWSWQDCWMLAGAAAVAVSALGVLVVRNKPEDAGTVPAGTAAGRPDPDRAAVAPHYQRDVPVRAALATPLFLSLVLASIAAVGAVGLLTAHGVLHLMDAGISQTAAASVLAAFPMSALTGKIAVGLIGERVEARLISGAAVIGSGAGLVLLVSSSTIATAVAGAALIGFGFGVLLVCGPVILGEQFGRKSFAMLAGLVLGIQSIVGALAPLLSGYAYDLGWGYAPGFYATGLVGAVAGATLILMPRTVRNAVAE